MLGMNDVCRYEYGKNDEKSITKREHAIVKYEKNMRSLIERLKEGGVRTLVILTPTIFDQYVKGAKFAKNLKGCDDGLVKMSAICAKLAESSGCGFVDLHSPMLKETLKAQKENPEFSMINRDRTHPNIIGYSLMTLEILKAQKVAEIVFKAELTQKTAKLAERCVVKKLSIKPGSVSFSLRPESLPMPIPGYLRHAPTIKKRWDSINKCVLKVTGLRKGDHSLNINGVALGVFSSDRLSKGVNLTKMKKFPPLKQAAKLAAAIESVIKTEREKIRGPKSAVPHIRIARYRATMKKEPFPKDDTEAAKFLIAGKTDNYRKSLFRKYLKYFDKELETRKELNEMMRKVYQMNSPETLTIKLSR
jgi:hypothetical protein